MQNLPGSLALITEYSVIGLAVHYEIHCCVLTFSLLERLLGWEECSVLGTDTVMSASQSLL